MKLLRVLFFVCLFGGMAQAEVYLCRETTGGPKAKSYLLALTDYSGVLFESIQGDSFQDSRREVKLTRTLREIVFADAAAPVEDVDWREEPKCYKLGEPHYFFGVDTSSRSDIHSTLTLKPNLISKPYSGCSIPRVGNETPRTLKCEELK